jgi:hypothetical protein
MESFLCRIDLPPEARATHVGQLLGRFAGARPVEDGRFSPSGRNFEVRRESAIVEVELIHDGAHRVVRSLYVRYALCNPEGADSMYATVVFQLAQAFAGATIEIADDVPDGFPHVFVVPTLLELLTTSVVAGVRLMREDWRRSGGVTDKAATCREALEWLVVGQGQASSGK